MSLATATATLVPAALVPAALVPAALALYTAESAALDALALAPVPVPAAPVPGITFISNFSAALIGQLCEFLDIEQLLALYIAMPEKMQYLKAMVIRRLRETDCYTSLPDMPAKLLRLLFGGYISPEHVIDLNTTLGTLVKAVSYNTLTATMTGLVDWSAIQLRQMDSKLELTLNYTNQEWFTRVGEPKQGLADYLHQYWHKSAVASCSLRSITGYYDVLVTMPYSETVIGIFENFIAQIQEMDYYEDENIKVLRIQLLAHIWSIRKMCEENNYTKTWLKTLLMLRTYVLYEMETDDNELYSLMQEYTNLSLKSIVKLFIYANKN